MGYIPGLLEMAAKRLFQRTPMPKSLAGWFHNQIQTKFMTLSDPH
jgi:hypothetical protein